MSKRVLPQVPSRAVGLGQPTIMNGALAAAHGVDYVHLAAFAIDIDRVFNEIGDDPELPMGWEVFLLLAYVLGRFDGHGERDRTLLEDVALDILGHDPAEPRLGGSLAFAIHAGVQRDLLDAGLRSAFRQWRSQPRQLSRALDPLFEHPRDSMQAQARRCLAAQLTPPLAPPTLLTLEKMASGEFAMDAHPVDSSHTQ